MAAQTYVRKSISARRLTGFPLIIDPKTGKATYGPPVTLSQPITITVTESRESLREPGDYIFEE